MLKVSKVARNTIGFSLSIIISGFGMFEPAFVYAQPPKQAAKPATPAGMVPAAEALKRIRAHEATITARKNEMTQLYDKDVFNTLKTMFIRNQVHQTAMMYVDSWSGNGVYLLWVNGVRPYYDYHLNALQESAKELWLHHKPYMKASDLEYLDRGMEVWQQKEPRVASLMSDYVYHMAKRAHFLGEAMKFTSDNRYFSIHTPEFRQAHEAEVEIFKEMAEKASEVVGDTRKKAEDAGRWYLFSSVTAPDRIAIEEQPARRYTINNLSLNRTNWEVRQAELQREIQRVQTDLDILSRQADEQLLRIARAFEQSDALKREKQELDRQIIAKNRQIHQAANPEPQVPANAKTLYEQKQNTERELKDVEDLIIAASQQGRQSSLPRLFRQRDHLQDQLNRINQALKEKMPEARVDEAAVETARTELAQLENQYWDKRKEEMRAFSELDMAKNLISQTFEEMDKVKDRWYELELQKRQMDANGIPSIRTVQVNANGQPVYKAEWQGPFDLLDAKNREVREMETVVAELKQAKDDAFRDFKTKAQEASDFLTSLHGDSVSQGNGAWATLKDVFSNNGTIFDNARGQAAVDFGMNAYEVFVEGWGKGGPAGAIVETMNKVAAAGIQYGLEDATGALDVSGYQSDYSINQTNAQHNAELTDYLSTPEIVKTGIYRAIEDGATRHLRDLGNRTAGVNMLRRFAQADRMQFVQNMRTAGVTAAELRAQGQRLNTHRSRLMQLSSREAYSLKDLGTSALKDALKNALKQYFQQEENALWESFMLAEAGQVNLYHVYRNTAASYWTAYDELQRLKRDRAELANGYDPRSGFRVLLSQPFDDKAQLNIQVLLRQPEGHRETVSLSGVSAQAIRPHEFQMKAGSIPHSGSDPALVELQISQQ